MRLHRTLVFSLALLAAACRAPGKDDHIADEIPEEPAAAAPAEPDTTSVEDPEYERRVAAMSTYEQCIKQTNGLPAEQAAIIKKACENRRKTPK